MPERRDLSNARRWWQLPQDSIWPQLGLLQGFQQVVELQESSRILVDLGQQMGAGPRADHTYTELKARSTQNTAAYLSCEALDSLRLQQQVCSGVLHGLTMWVRSSASLVHCTVVVST